MVFMSTMPTMMMVVMIRTLHFVLMSIALEVKYVMGSRKMFLVFHNILLYKIFSQHSSVSYKVLAPYKFLTSK